MLLNGRLKGRLKILGTDIDVSLGNRMLEVVPLVGTAGEGEPDLQVTEPFIELDLFYEGIDQLPSVLVASFSWFLGQLLRLEHFADSVRRNSAGSIDFDAT